MVNYFVVLALHSGRLFGASAGVCRVVHPSAGVCRVVHPSAGVGRVSHPSSGLGNPLTLVLIGLILFLRCLNSTAVAQDILSPLNIKKIERGEKNLQIWIDVARPPAGKEWRIDSTKVYYRDEIGMTERVFLPERVSGTLRYPKEAEGSILRYNFLTALPQDGTIEPELIYSLQTVGHNRSALRVLNLVLPGYGDHKLQHNRLHLLKTGLFVGATITGIWAHNRAVSHYRSFGEPANPTDWDQRHRDFETAQSANRIAIGVGVLTATFYLHHQIRFGNRLGSNR